jgi:hypothetical protein
LLDAAGGAKLDPPPDWDKDINITRAAKIKIITLLFRLIPAHCVEKLLVSELLGNCFPKESSKFDF